MFNNFSILTKIFILAGTMAIAFIVYTVITLFAIYGMLGNLDEMYEGGAESIKGLADLQNFYEINLIDTLHKVHANNISWGEGQEALKDLPAQISQTWAKYLNFLAPSSRQELANRIQDLEREIQNSLPLLNQASSILKQHNEGALNVLISEKLYMTLEPIIKQINHLIDWHAVDTQNDYRNAVDKVSYIKKELIVLLIVFLAISVGIATVISRRIVNSIKIGLDAVKRLSLGDLNIDIHNDSRDEIGQLLDAIKEMAHSKLKVSEAFTSFSKGDLNINIEPRSGQDTFIFTLNDMIASSKRMNEIFVQIAKGDLTVSVEPRSAQDVLGITIANMANKLKQIMRNIQSNVSSLTTTSKEIASSVSQVATSSSETAAALTETTTTIEELKQTAQVSTDKAKEVLSSAEETLQVLKTSERSLQSTIEDMGKIDEKMRDISAGIIKLSEHTQTIGEIIDTVNDLAEQSNLLAVNAAIEAAKAGEQGKSFNVVAQEIRTLAEQSKSATIQVRKILSDIQNATSAAVLATEQGSKAVEKGVSQSNQTSESMRTLSESMSHVGQAASQIVLSSQQQLIGVDQVTVAMGNINEAAKDYVNNMHQIEKAVVTVNTVVKTLKDIVDQYSLDEKRKYFVTPAKNNVTSLAQGGFLSNIKSFN